MLDGLRRADESRSIADLERYVNLLEAELVAVGREIIAVNPGEGNGTRAMRSPEDEARYLRLVTRRDAIADQFRLAVRTLESRRLGALMSDTGGAN